MLNFTLFLMSLALFSVFIFITHDPAFGFKYFDPFSILGLLILLSALFSIYIIVTIVLPIKAFFESAKNWERSIKLSRASAIMMLFLFPVGTILGLLLCSKIDLISKKN